MKNGTVAPPCVKFHIEILSAVDVKTITPITSETWGVITLQGLFHLRSFSEKKNPRRLKINPLF